MTQSADVPNAEASVGRSNIACHICRRRKTKCGRELPQCSSCQQYSLQCEYPEKAMRPGPKIGSSQAPRKRRIQPSNNDTDLTAHRKRRNSQIIGSTPSNSPPNEGLSPEQETNCQNDASIRQAQTVHSLSFIIHPTHDSCSPEDQPVLTPENVSPITRNDLTIDSCYALGISRVELNQLIDRYFEDFTSFQLFREADFQAKLQRITNPLQHRSLLASMLIFSTKRNDDPQTDIDGQENRSSRFCKMALKFIDGAIEECADDALPLPLFQAVILLTHWLLVQGVKGRAWRFLGLAIRTAYELNLHLIDRKRDRYNSALSAEQWCIDEEYRRAWWAVWEMDVFASVIKRCPTGIDWSQNETFLPASDDAWIRGEVQDSCFLDPRPTHRWKLLEASKNKSAKAWFIVINSLTKDAQTITGPVGIEGNVPTKARASAGSIEQFPGRRTEQSLPKESVVRLITIRNALHCTLMALPSSLQYQGVLLDFGAQGGDRSVVAASKLRDFSFYSIHLITQLTKLLIYKCNMFAGLTQVYGEGERRAEHDRVTPTGERAGLMPANNEALQLAVQAADEILFVVRRSDDNHYKFVNPFLANTIWLAGAVQLVYSQLSGSSITDKDLTDSHVELLRLTHNRFVAYWGLPMTMRKDLEVIESEIQVLKTEISRRGVSRQQTPFLTRSSVPRDVSEGIQVEDRSRSILIAPKVNGRTTGSTQSNWITEGSNEQCSSKHPRRNGNHVRGEDLSSAMSERPNGALADNSFSYQSRNQLSQLRQQALCEDFQQDGPQTAPTSLHAHDHALQAINVVGDSASNYGTQNIENSQGLTRMNSLTETNMPAHIDSQILPSLHSETLDTMFFASEIGDNLLDVSGYLDSMFLGPYMT